MADDEQGGKPHNPELLEALTAFEGHLAAFRAAIEAGDVARCRELIADARQRRAGQSGE